MLLKKDEIKLFVVRNLLSDGNISIVRNFTEQVQNDRGLANMLILVTLVIEAVSGVPCGSCGSNCRSFEANTTSVRPLH